MKNLNHIMYFVIILFIAGCYVSQNIKTKDEFIEKSKTNSISLMTKDTTKYFLTEATLQDSVISGFGQMEKKGITKDFQGDIKLSDVVYIQARDLSVWGTVAAVGVIGFLGVSTAAIIGDANEGTKVKVVYPYGSDGGSCPFIYSKINSEFKPEGEAIPLSLGKKLETETTNLLSYLTAGKKECKLRIANERPETHYINSVRLFRYDCKPGNSLLADESNKVWPVVSPESPLFAEDFNKHNIKSEIVKADEHYWESDLSAASPAGGFRDGMIITFEKGKYQKSASLIVKAINTRISDVLFRKIYEFLGDEVLDFVYAAENDPQIISPLKGWMEEVSLKAFIWDGKLWKYAGKIYPEATRQPFERIIRMDVDDIKTDELKIKLEFMTDVWKIDAVKIDFSDINALEPVEIPIVSANFSGREIKEKILKRDNDYQTLLPGDKIDFIFYDKYATQYSRYFLNVSGYLYEWYVEGPDSDADFLAFKPQGVSRFELFKVMLNDKNLLLPPVYREWEKVKSDLN